MTGFVNLLQARSLELRCSNFLDQWEGPGLPIFLFAVKNFLQVVLAQLVDLVAETAGHNGAVIFAR